MEIWQDIKGFEGLYKISTYGRVKSLGNGNSTNTATKKQRIMKTGIASNGYVKIKLNKASKRYYKTMHRLVAENFLINPNNKPEVNHIDGNKENNNIDNLEWCTPSENQIHAFKIGKQKALKGKNNKQSKPIRQTTREGEEVAIWDSINEACVALGFNSFGIIKCCKKEKKYKTAYGFKWEYV